MEEKKVHLSSSCSISVISYENISSVDVSLDYTEHSPSHGYGDTETSVDIDREKAVEIVSALKGAFKI